MASENPSGDRPAWWVRSWRTVADWWWSSAPTRTRGRYIIGNSFRWAFTTALLAFLLILTVAINEALNFQTRVTDLAGSDEHARRVILVLHEMREKNQLEQDRTLPFGAMAVKLDAIVAAHRNLSGFKGFGDAQDAGANGGTNPAIEDTEDSAKEARAAFGKLNARLQRELGELESDLSDQDVGIRVARDLTLIGESIKELRRFELTPLAGEEPVPADDGSELTAGAEAGIDLEGLTNTLEQTLADVEKQIDIEPESRLVSVKVTDLDELRGKLFTLQEGIGKVAELRFKDELQTKVAVASGANGHSGGEASGVVAGKDKADDQPRSQPAALSVDREPVAEGTGEVDHDQAYQQILGGIEDDASLIRSSLSVSEPEFALASKIAQHINDMRQQVNALGKLPLEGPEFRHDEQGEIITGSEAEARFEATLGHLTGALQKLTATLGNRTPVMVVADEIPDAGADADIGPSGKARTVLRDYQALDRFAQVLLPLQFIGVGDRLGAMGRVGFHPQQLATLSRDSLNLLFVLFVGAIGAVIYMTKHQLQRALEGHRLSSPPSRSLAWFFVRPMFGVFIAFAAYLLVRAGQLALGDASPGLATTFNLPILSVVALFAGLLSWQALDAIESKGRVWFRSVSRRDLWATGLDSSLHQGERGLQECAHQIGRSPEQIERWIMFQDRVTPEMQDRLASWLERPVSELFSDEDPKTVGRKAPMFATGLKDELASNHRLDVKSLAEMIGEDDSRRVERWVECELQVSPPMQWRLVDALNVSHRQLFDPGKQRRDAWAFGLAAALKGASRNAESLGDALGLSPDRIAKWTGQTEPVPPAWQDRIAAELGVGQSLLFRHGKA